jgi:hypothetical protein
MTIQTVKVVVEWLETGSKQRKDRRGIIALPSICDTMSIKLAQNRIHQGTSGP